MGLSDESEAVGGAFQVKLLLGISSANSNDNSQPLSQALCSVPSGAYSPHRNPGSQLLSSPFSDEEAQAEEWSQSRLAERQFLSPIVKTA